MNKYPIIVAGGGVKLIPVPPKKKHLNHVMREMAEALRAQL